MTSKDRAAWAIAIGGVALEVFIATLDYWFDIPHYVIQIRRKG
jgi:hypothetical protein